MSLRVAVLGSGSSGNCTLIRSEACTLLIDAGFSAKRTQQLLGAHGLQLSEITAVLLTHEHGDHTAGLAGIAKLGTVAVYTNRSTARYLEGKLEKQPDWRLFETGSTFRIGDLEIDTVSVPHDAQDPVGYVVRHATSGASFGCFTDLGHVPANVANRIRNVTTLSIEANHCHEMLAADNRRPWSLRQRISGRHGHLSNARLIEALEALEAPSWRRLVLTHLSRDCNRPELVEKVVGESRIARDLQVIVVRPDEGTPLFDA